MRFIHTADWHLGKTLKGQSLIEDQKYILERFLEIVDSQKVDAIVIAGDIYDRSVPPEEAVNLFDWILNELILERGLHVLGIAGNHDSESRLNFGNKLFENSKFHIRAKLTEDMEPIVINDDFGEVYFSLIPYFEPIKVKALLNLNDEEELSFNDAAEKLVEIARSKIPKSARSVAVTHAFIVGGKESGSERKLPGGIGVGGAELVKPSHFKDYTYTALGHLHGSTFKSSNPNIRYSGSLLKYSFDEWKQAKSVTLVEIDREGNVSIDNNLPLIPIRDVRVIKGNIQDILDNEPNSDDYISVQYEGSNLTNLNAKMRNKFVNLLEFKPLDRVLSKAMENVRQREGTSPLDLFRNFFKDTTGTDLMSEELEVIKKVIGKCDGSNNK